MGGHRRGGSSAVDSLISHPFGNLPKNRTDVVFDGCMPTVLANLHIRSEISAIVADFDQVASSVTFRHNRP
jgi:hypothetical protein